MVIDLNAIYTATPGGEDPVGVEGPGQTCFDTIDNDGDGDTDCDDEDCSNRSQCKP